MKFDKTTEIMPVDNVQNTCEPSYPYKDRHVKDKTVFWLSYL